VWAAGPWRTSGEWWLRGEIKEDIAMSSAHPWVRDEWDVAISRRERSKVAEVSTVKRSARIEEVALFRLTREVESGAWWVEAGYD